MQRLEKFNSNELMFRVSHIKIETWATAVTGNWQSYRLP
jgi:hypothetical protein